MALETLTAAAALVEREWSLRPDAEYSAGVRELPDKLGAIADAAAAFADARVPYALIGGLAVGIRTGVPRATLDVDFAIPTSADRVALTACFVARGLSPTGVFPHSMNFQHSTGEPVQLAFDEQFDAMIERAEILSVGERTLRVVTRDDLITMKRRAASDPARRRSKALRDQADLAMLEGDIPTPDEGW